MSRGELCARCPSPTAARRACAPLKEGEEESRHWASNDWASEEPLGSVALTVRLLSGEPLVELSAEEHLSADELRAEVQAKAGGRLPEGCCVGSLLWCSTELEGTQTLRERGLRGKQDVVALLQRGIEGDFERHHPGCPVCDCCCYEAWALRLELSGDATLRTLNHSGREETRTFGYTLGEAEGWEGRGGNRRSVRLEEKPRTLADVRAQRQWGPKGRFPALAACAWTSVGVREKLPAHVERGGQAASKVFEGWLELDATDPVHRILCVDGLNVDPCDPRQRQASQFREILEDVFVRRRRRQESELREQAYQRYLIQRENRKTRMSEEERRESKEAAQLVMVTDVLSWYPTDAANEARVRCKVFCRPRHAAKLAGHRSRREERETIGTCRRHQDARAEAARVRMRCATRRLERTHSRQAEMMA